MEGDLENLKILSLEESSLSSPNSDISNVNTDIDGINAPAMLPQEIFPETAWIEILTCFRNTKTAIINLSNVSPYLERVLLTRVTKLSKVDLLCGKIFSILLSKKYLNGRDFDSCLKSRNLKWYNLWKSGIIRPIQSDVTFSTTAPYTSADVVAFGEVIEEDEMVQSWHYTIIVFSNSAGQHDYWKTVSNFMNKSWNKHLHPQFNIHLKENELPRPYRGEDVPQVQSVDYSMFLNCLTIENFYLNVRYNGQGLGDEMSNERTLSKSTFRSKKSEVEEQFASYGTNFLHANDDFLQVVSNKIDGLTVRLSQAGIPEEIQIFNHSFEKLTNFTLLLPPLQLQEFYNVLPDLTIRKDLNIQKLTLPYQPWFQHGTYVGLCNRIGVSELQLSSVHGTHFAREPLLRDNAEMDDVKNSSVVVVGFLIHFQHWGPFIDHIKQFLPRLVKVKEVSFQLMHILEPEMIEFAEEKQNDFWDYLPNGKVVNFKCLPLHPHKANYEAIKYELLDRDGVEFKTKMTRVAAHDQ